ncbi:OsmC family protein [Kineococcus gynurae]|uniref:OsmC family protein n=1 Tax=Kineococcus gynurae TaxID=452979 RepID=A0ABV5LWP8_9ACTN
MDATELRALQKPLKDTYREDPEQARIPARAVAVLDGQTIGVSVDGFAGTTRAGLHRAAGGDGTEACSADMLCEAVAACAGVTLRSVATAMGVQLREASVTVDAHWDARGTLGVSKEAPVGITDVTITFSFSSDADEATEGKLVSLAERYCVIAQTLQTPPSVTVVRG